MNAPTYSRIRMRVDGATCALTLAAPERRNAIGPVMANELLDGLLRAQADNAVRVILLEAEGKTFCAGGDFVEMQMLASGALAPGELPQHGDFADLMRAMMTSEKPIVAKVAGHAMGGGFGLVAASTFAVAAEGVMLGTPEIDVGIFPMMIMPVLVRFIPRRRLMQMMLLGERLAAREAMALGVLNQVVAADALDETVRALVDALSTKSPSAMRHGLRAFAAQDDLGLDEALPLLQQRLSEVIATEDAGEGFSAFLEKRKPVWSGR